jgi:hypothetical protein
VDEQAAQAAQQRAIADELACQLDEAKQQAKLTKDALDQLERQRERERASGATPQPPQPPGGASPAPRRAVPVATPLPPAGKKTPPPDAPPPPGAPPDSPAATGAYTTGQAVAYSGQAEGLSTQLHGASWLLEATQRQARTDALVEEAEHYRARVVAVCIARRRERTLIAIWRAWGGLVLASRRRQEERLRRMAGSIVAAATVSGESPSALVPLDEWWERGVVHKPRPPPTRSPVDRRTVV